MSVDTQKYINDLMQQFRDLVVEIEDDQNDLTRKLNDLALLSASANYTSTSSASSNSTSNALLTVTASPTDEPSAATTLSSSSTTTGSTKPPSYKSAIRPKETYEKQPHLSLPSHQQINHIPQRPPRNRSRATLPRPTVTYSNNITANTNRSHLVTRGMASNSVSRGALIVLEGLDRVGKSTLATKLVEHLERISRPVSYCRFPDRSTPIGQLIDTFLKNSKKVDDHAMHLLFSANRWELDKTIRDALYQGTTVVLDRYSYSGIAYSSAKKNLTMEWCRETERGLPRPDLVIYLELPKEAQYKRPGFGDERFETAELQEVVRRQYEKLITRSRENWLRIDVENKSPDQVLGEIIIPVKRCLESSANTELGDLDFI